MDRLSTFAPLGAVAAALALAAPMAASAAELESLEVRNLRPQEASAADALIKIAVGVPHLNLIPATDDNLAVIPNELSGPLAASCLGDASDPDPIYRYDTGGIRFDFGYFCDSISEKVIVKGFTEGRFETDALELHSKVVQIHPREPDRTLSYTIKLKLDGTECEVEAFEEVFQIAGWQPERADLVTPETMCSVSFAP